MNFFNAYLKILQLIGQGISMKEMRNEGKQPAEYLTTYLTEVHITDSNAAMPCGIPHMYLVYPRSESMKQKSRMKELLKNRRVPTKGYMQTTEPV